ncbi:MAG: PIN domain-containing protein [Candidatus Marinimicrobia bacterium]|nr:PIN domain-containing protein [Candidatus Neomarinimicrobiota bacterium]
MNLESKARYLLDTSAFMTFLEDEKGADEVEFILRSGKVLCPFVVLLEIYYITLRERGQEIADKRYAVIRNLNVEFINNIDEPTLITAGRFKGKFRISLADAIIAAYAKINDAILVHKDPEYECLKKEVSQYKLPYK